MPGLTCKRSRSCLQLVLSSLLNQPWSLLFWSPSNLVLVNARGDGRQMSPAVRRLRKSRKLLLDSYDDNIIFRVSETTANSTCLLTHSSAAGNGISPNCEVILRREKFVYCSPHFKQAPLITDDRPLFWCRKEGLVSVERSSNNSQR